MLENISREVRAGEWALLCDSTSWCPGSWQSLAAEWNREQKLISCFAILFFMKRWFFYFTTSALVLCNGCKRQSEQNNRTHPCLLLWDKVAPVPSPSTVLRLDTKLSRFCVPWAAPTFVISDAGIWHLTHLEQVRVLCHPAFVNAWHFLSFGQELERKLVYLEKGFFCLLMSIHTFGRKDIRASVWNIWLNYKCEEVAEEMA